MPAARREATRWTLHRVLDSILRLLHPFMPFITEDLWQRMPGAEGSLMLAAYPTGSTEDFSGFDSIDWLMDLVNRVRNLRAEKGLPPSQRLDAVVVRADHEADAALGRSMEEVAFLARLSGVTRADSLPQGEEWVAGVAARFQFALRVPAASRDVEGERKRLEGELRKAKLEHGKFSAKLESPAFVDRAPAEVVEKNRRLLAEYGRKIAELEVALEKLAR